MRRRLDYLLVFAVAALLLGWIQLPPTFIDPDAFYHAKMALLTRDAGPVRSFPWLPLTTLGARFADHHFLYHLLLIPFVSAFEPLVGVKIATALFGALAATAFLFMLRALRLSYAVPATLVFAFSYSVLGRLSLGKANALSLALLFVVLAALCTRRRIVLFAACWLSVWLHGGWPLALVAGVACAVAQTGARAWAGPAEARRLRAADLEGIGVVVAGLVAGLVLNPFFPQNLGFYWDQIFQIAVVNYQGAIDVGREWYPYPLARLIVENSVIFLALAVLVLLTLIANAAERLGPRLRQARPDDVALLLLLWGLAALFLGMTLRHARHAEYFIPFAVAALLAAFNRLAPVLAPRLRAALARPGWPRAAPLKTSALCALVALLCLRAGRDAASIRASFEAGIPLTRLAAASQWIAGNTAPDTVVVSGDWGSFPALFYRDTTHRYVCGLDPTFFFRADPAAFQSWDALRRGELDGDVATVLARELLAGVVLVERENSALDALLARSAGITLAYQDREARVYVLSRLPTAPLRR